MRRPTRPRWMRWMPWMRWMRWRRRPAPAPEDPARREEAIRGRLAALEVQWLTLLADDTIPARKHRLDAVRAARGDLESELHALVATN